MQNLNLMDQRPMARKERGQTMPIRIDVESLRAAKIAASFKGLSVMQYASKVLLEQAERDIEEGYKQRSNPPPTRGRRSKTEE